MTIGSDLEPWDLDQIVAPRDALFVGIRAETHDEAEGLARGAARRSATACSNAT